MRASFFSSKNAKVSLSSPPLAFDPFALAIIAPLLFLCYWEAVHTYVGSIATALYRPSAGLFPEQRLVIELTHGMTSDRDKIDTHFSWPRKHFFASTIVLQVIVYCRRGVGSISSNRHVPRWFHCTVFFGAPLTFLHVVKFFFRYNLFLEASQWACFVVTSFSCPYFFGSSFRRPSCIQDSNKLSQLFPP